MAERQYTSRVLPARPSLSDILNLQLSRRDLLRNAGQLGITGIVFGALSQRQAIEDYVDATFDNNEFLRDAIPLTRHEIDKALSEYKESETGFEWVDGKRRGVWMEGEFEGVGREMYLEFPGIVRSDPTLTVFDILLDNRRHLRTGIMSSQQPSPKRVMLGPVGSKGKHTVQIYKVDSREEEAVVLEEAMPRLWYPETENNLRTLVDSTTALTAPRRGERVWNDCIVRKVALPFMQDGNYRIITHKVTTAEDSRYESLYREYYRTYDDDWETKVEVTPEGKVVQVFIQRSGHSTRRYNHENMAYGTHPYVEIYTNNGMVDQEDYFYEGNVHFAEQPLIVPAQEARLLWESKAVDPILQDVSFDELRRERRNKETMSELIVDFRKRQSRKKIF